MCPTMQYTKEMENIQIKLWMVVRQLQQVKTKVLHV